jgi:ABC-type nitrate/sulfonate/bicarbonate transport system ATPase subunit
LQDYGLLPWESVHQNVTLGLRVRKFYGPDGTHAPSDEAVRAINTQAGYWIERLGLESVSAQFPGQISGGQRQRTAIARTLALNPDVLLMDEPFASLDAPTRESLQKLVLQLHAEQDLTTVIVTHSIEEATFLGKKILLLGNPPNWQAQIIANPGAGADDYLNSAAYVDVCNHLRLALEAVA